MSDNDEQLKALYPFLHGSSKDSAVEHQALLNSAQQKAAHSVDVKQRFFATHTEQLIAAARAVAGVYLNKGRMFSMGNGGNMKQSGLLDHCLVVNTDSIHRTQEVRVACYHILRDLVHTLLADRRGKLGAQ